MVTTIQVVPTSVKAYFDVTTSQPDFEVTTIDRLMSPSTDQTDRPAPSPRQQPLHDQRTHSQRESKRVTSPNSTHRPANSSTERHGQPADEGPPRLASPAGTRPAPLWGNAQPPRARDMPHGCKPFSIRDRWLLLIKSPLSTSAMVSTGTPEPYVSKVIVPEACPITAWA